MQAQREKGDPAVTPGRPNQTSLRKAGGRQYPQPPDRMGYRQTIRIPLNVKHETYQSDTRISGCSRPAQRPV
jgi:hypothetical protein